MGEAGAGGGGEEAWRVRWLRAALMIAAEG